MRLTGNRRGVVEVKKKRAIPISGVESKLSLMLRRPYLFFQTTEILLQNKTLMASNSINVSLVFYVDWKLGRRLENCSC